LLHSDFDGGEAAGDGLSLPVGKDPVVVTAVLDYEDGSSTSFRLRVVLRPLLQEDYLDFVSEGPIKVFPASAESGQLVFNGDRKDISARPVFSLELSLYYEHGIMKLNPDLKSLRLSYSHSGKVYNAVLA